MDERTLYRTLAEAPDDEGHCMVFADWLHERGDPMAEFLTLQLEGHKKKLDTLRAQRAQDLLIMNWKRWAGELARVLHRRACVYERGFLRVASGGLGASAPVDAIKDAPQWSTVRALTLDGPAAVVGRVLESPWLKNVKRLECSAEVLANGGSFAFQLTQLTLTGNAASSVKSNPAWDALELLTLAEFAPTTPLPFSARQVHCRTGTFDHSLSVLSGWLHASKRPEVMTIEGQDATVSLEDERVDLKLFSIDRRELRALQQLGDLEINLEWEGRRYTGPARKAELTPGQPRRARYAPTQE